MSIVPETPSVDNLILYEQLRLPLRAMRWAIYPGLLLLLMIYLAMGYPCNGAAIGIWCAITAIIWLVMTFHAHYRLQLDFTPVRAKKLLLELKLLYAVEGAVWGSLPWVTLDSCEPISIALAITANAGVAASRMMLLSSLPVLFHIYILVGGTVWVAKAFSFNGLPMYALGLVGILYVVTLLFQARVYARTLIGSIRLRFENQRLSENLNAQIAIANAARQQAEDATRAKSKFFAAAGHDLRQPAQAQGLFIEVLSRTPLDEKQRKLLDSLRTASQASAEMLNTLLDYSRIEAGVIEPTRVVFKLQSILNKIKGEFGLLADTRNLFYRSRDTTLFAHSDPALVHLILRNLLSNALRYTSRGGVLLACRRRGQEAWLEVWDTGIGIAPEHQEEVFREFHQLNNPERDQRKGLGLGLAIVDGLVKCLGHTLSVSSRPGRGSLFRLALPLALSATENNTADNADSPPFQCNARVLVIDDDAAIRTGLSHLIRDWGCSCETVESIDAALECARQNPPTLVISDFRLRNQETGIQAIAALRRELDPALPALLLSGDTAPDRLNEARASGILLLHKPVFPEVLRAALQHLLTDSPHCSSTHILDK